uniref:Uncharacterized protein n=1 Tax=Panagrolaimus davidi TaxID=227884 RepID=A0A914P8R1_9BILA
MFYQIIAVTLIFLFQIEAYINSYGYDGSKGYNSYSYQQNYALSQPYGYSNYPSNYNYNYNYYNNNYNPYSHLYIGNYPIVRPNQGMLPGGFVEPGNIGVGNNIASAFLFCMSCSSRG